MKFVVAGLLFVITAASLACTGDGEPSLDDYFAKVDALFTAAETRGSAIEQTPVGAESLAFEQRKALAHDSAEDIAEINDDLVVGLEDVDPPTEVERLHGLYVGAARDRGTALRAHAERLAAADSEEALSSAAQDIEAIADAIIALQDICIDLQDAAGEYEIDVDLWCNE